MAGKCHIFATVLPFFFYSFSKTTFCYGKIPTMFATNLQRNPGCNRKLNANIGYLVTVWNRKEMKELVQTCSMYSRCLDASKAATSSLVGSESWSLTSYNCARPKQLQYQHNPHFYSDTARKMYFDNLWSLLHWWSRSCSKASVTWAPKSKKNSCINTLKYQ